jgi:hypothetical protein
MPFLTVLSNEQWDVIGTARTQMEGHGTGPPGRTSVVARPGQRVIEIEVGDDVLNLDPSTLHEFIKVNHLRPTTDSNVEASLSTPTHDDGRADGPSEKRSSPTDDRDLVVTPGGPRPRESVHPVRPGEVVRRNPDGTYTVTPKSGSVKGTKRPQATEKKPKTPRR